MRALVFVLLGACIASVGGVPDYYRLLGVGKNAGDTEIRKAYRALALRYHPDKNPNNAEAAKTFAAVDAAYRTLMNPYQRIAYDHQKLVDDSHRGSAVDEDTRSECGMDMPWTQDWGSLEQWVSDVIDRHDLTADRLWAIVFTSAMLLLALFRLSIPFGRISTDHRPDKTLSGAPPAHPASSEFAYDDHVLSVIPVLPSALPTISAPTEAVPSDKSTTCKLNVKHSSMLHSISSPEGRLLTLGSAIASRNAAFHARMASDNSLEGMHDQVLSPKWRDLLSAVDVAVGSDDKATEGKDTSPALFPFSSLEDHISSQNLPFMLNGELPEVLSSAVLVNSAVLQEPDCIAATFAGVQWRSQSKGPAFSLDVTSMQPASTVEIEFDKTTEGKNLCVDEGLRFPRASSVIQVLELGQSCTADTLERYEVVECEGNADAMVIDVEDDRVERKRRREDQESDSEEVAKKILNFGV